MRDVFDKDSGARRSSLRAVHRLTTEDRHYDIQLLRGLEIVNARTWHALGPLPPGGIPREVKRRPDPLVRSSSGETLVGQITEKEKMDIKHLAMAAAMTVTSGCHPGIKSWHMKSKVEDGVLKIPFYDHGFDARCYETLKCRVLYGNRYIVNDGGPRGPFTERDRASLGSHWARLDLPSLARVIWTSKDGENHDETIDLSHIFESHLILYPDDLDVRDVDLVPYSGTPDIILVVEDRSIHIYMKAWISLLKPRYPGREHSNFRHDPVVAYSKKF